MCAGDARQGARDVSAGVQQGEFPGPGGPHPATVAGPRRLSADVVGAGGAAPLHALRGPADHQRHARHAPRAGPGVQGRDPALQDDAGLPALPQGRLGHARPARGAGGGEGAGLHHQAGDRGVRHRPVQRAVPRERAAVQGRVGGADGARRVLDRPGRPVRDLPQRLHPDGLVDHQGAVGPGAGVPGVPGDAPLPALRDVTELPRGLAGVQGGHAGPVHLRALPAGGRAGRGARRGAAHGVVGDRVGRPRAIGAGVDDDAVDADGEHGAGRRAGRGLRAPALAGRERAGAAGARAHRGRAGRGLDGGGIVQGQRVAGAAVLAAVRERDERRRLAVPAPGAAGGLRRRRGRDGHRPHGARLRRGGLRPGAAVRAADAPHRRHAGRAGGGVSGGRHVREGRGRANHRGPGAAGAALPRRHDDAHVPVLLAVRHAAALLRQAVLVHPHDGAQRTRWWP